MSLTGNTPGDRGEPGSCGTRDLRVTPQVERRVLVGIVVLAVAARVAAALYQGDALVDLPGIRDQVSYHTLARRVLFGYGFSFPAFWWPATEAGQPTAHWSYLYTLFLAGVYGLVGSHPLVARLLQAVVAGVLLPWLTWRLGRRLFGPAVGLAGAAISSLYIYYVYYAAALMTETFYILALLWSLDLATRMAGPSAADTTAPGSEIQLPGGGIRPFLLLGFALGLAAMLRQVVLLFVPALFAWVLWVRLNRGRDRSRSQASRRRMLSIVTGLAATSAVLLILILPWTFRNYHAFGRFVLLNTNAGYAFFWGNHPIYGTSFVPILPSEVYIDLIPPDLRPLNEAALDQALLAEGLRFVAEDPGRYVQLSISRIPAYFQFWPSNESGQLSNLSRVLSFGALLPLALYGLFLVTLRRKRYTREGAGPSLILLCLFALGYSLIHLLSWALIRYRLPVDAVAILFAAVGIVDLGTRVWRALLWRRTEPIEDSRLRPIESALPTRRTAWSSDPSENTRYHLWN